MSERRRGLGRGLGALIPSAPAGDRPVDVFFGEPRATPPAEEPDGAGVGGGAGLATLRWHVAAPEHGSTGNTAAAAQDVDRGTGAEPVPDGAPDVPAAAGTDEDRSDPDVPDEQPSDPAPEAGEDRTDGLVPVPGATFRELPLDRVSPNPRQPRAVFDADALTELVHSVREVGVLQPVVVRPVEADAEGPRYELVMGERRWRACREAGMSRIPAIVRETAQDDLLRDALLENLHRSDLNPLEEAAAYQQLLDDFGCTHEELAQRLGRSRPQISNTLRLLRLPALVQRRVAAGVLSAGHARALLGLEDPAAMERLAQRVVAEGLSVRATEEAVAVGITGGDESGQPRRRPRAGERHAALDDLAGRLSDRFDTRVRIALGRRKGTLTVDFASVEDLDRIVAAMVPDGGPVLGREAPQA